MKPRLSTLFTLLLAVGANLSVWAWFNRPQDPATGWHGTIAGVSYSPMQRFDDPIRGKMPTAAEINSDLALLSDKVAAIRTYGSSGVLEQIPQLAARHGLNVTMGAWIGPDDSRNVSEINALINASRDRNNVVGVLVGNESLLRNDVSPVQLIGYIRSVQRRLGQPVSTAEPWQIWLKYPELAHTADFIAVHILPYWEGINVNDAMDYVLMRYRELQHAYPDKPIVLAEVGWPSSGPDIGQAHPSLLNQVKFLRGFLNRAGSAGISSYYVVEAFDQPWKLMHEGSAGAYWGIYDANRHPKFPMLGEILPMPTWKFWALAAGVLALIPTAYFALRRRGIAASGKMLFALTSNFAASGFAWAASLGATHYQTVLSATVWITLLAMQVLALLVLLAETTEAVEVLWRRDGGRNFKALSPRPDYPYPKVSVHVPVHNEPPELVRQTLEALARLDYPDFEVLVIDNNTPDPAVWQPIEKLCAFLGSHFRFYHLENWPGYKAGALNYALQQTDRTAELIAVIDSDYVVSPLWLKSLAPYFEDPRVGFVQAPQDYRDGSDSLFKQMCYWEYAGFFHVGMVHRNDFNAIIQHGTMTLIRKEALQRAGCWSEWCICEDAELGLRLLASGYDSIYVPESLGKGVMPDSLSAYKTQRFRWAYGAVQIIKRHIVALLPFCSGTLSSAQKYYFVAGWLPWLSDGLALIFVISSLLLTTQMLISFPAAEVPVAAFLLPTVGIFCFKLLRGIWLYCERVRCGLARSLGAAVAGLALTHTVGRAVLLGLFSSDRPFVRTPKLEAERPLRSALSMVREELALLLALWTAAWAVSSRHLFQNSGADLWISILLVQSVPYLAAVLMALINVAYNSGAGRKVSHSSLPAYTAPVSASTDR